MLTPWIPDELYKRINQVSPRACIDIVLLRRVVSTDQAPSLVMLLKRCIDPLRGYWALPGGRLLRGEELIDAARRKISEELGGAVEEKLRGESCRFADIVPYFYPDRHDLCVTFSLVVPFATDVRPILDSQHTEYRWFNVAGLPDMIHPSTTRQVHSAVRVG